MNFRLYRNALLIALLYSGFATVAVLPLSGQTATTGNIIGFVRDGSGAVVPSCTVTARMAEQQFVRSAVSNNEGFYSLQAMPPGTYDITVRAKDSRNSHKPVSNSPSIRICVSMPCSRWALSKRKLRSRHRTPGGYDLRNNVRTN